MLFELFRQVFLVNSNVVEFTVIDHLKLLMFWAIVLTVLHYVLLVTKTVTKVFAKPVWNLMQYIAGVLGCVYFSVVGAIGGIYYVICMTPLLLVSSIVVGVIIPLGNGMYVLGSNCGNLIDDVMVYTGVIPRFAERLYVWACTLNQPILEKEDVVN